LEIVVDGGQMEVEMEVDGNEGRVGWRWRADGDGGDTGVPCAKGLFQLGKGMPCL